MKPKSDKKRVRPAQIMGYSSEHYFDLNDPSSRSDFRKRIGIMRQDPVRLMKKRGRDVIDVRSDSHDRFVMGISEDRWLASRQFWLPACEQPNEIVAGQPQIT